MQPVASEAVLQQRLAEAQRRSDAGDLAGARSLYQSLMDQPELTPVCLYRLGLIAGAGGDHRRAAQLVRQALTLKPDLWDAYPVLSAALNKGGERSAAIGALVDFGCALDAAGQLERATQVFQEILKSDPLNYATWVNCGRELAYLGRPRAAAPYIAQGLRLYGRGQTEVLALVEQIERTVGDRLKLAGEPLPPGSAHGRLDLAENALVTLGKILSDVHCGDEAIACYRLALKLAPGYALAHWNLAQALLVQGDWHAGWQEYEWRWHWPECPEPRKRVPVPIWYGEPVAGKRVLVWTEQGYGDAIQFLPLLHRLMARGAEVTLETPFPLRRLFANSLPGIAVVNRPDRPDVLAKTPTPDCIVPLMSLPARFDLAPGDLPLARKYLKPLAEDVAHWSARLASRPRPRVGLIWAGRTNAIPFEALAGLVSAPGVTWCSLQLGSESAALDHAGLANVVNCAAEIKDFADTAAVLSHLDLLITVDTGVAHLAGALGKPVCVIVNHQPNWRWGLTGDRSPWYPSMRLYRRSLDQDWAEVIAIVRRGLDTWIGKFAAAQDTG